MDKEQNTDWFVVFLASGWLGTRLIGPFPTSMAALGWANRQKELPQYVIARAYAPD